jgi:hypothetical protein
MLTVTPHTAVVDSRVPLDTAQAPADTAPQAHAATSQDPVAAFAANNGLHPDVAKYADPKKNADGRALPLEAKKDKAPLNSPPAGKCQAPDPSYDVSKVTDAQIKDLRQCGHKRLADTIVNAKTSYADLLAMKPPVTIRVVTSAGNGGEPVMVVTGPKFKPDADVHVHTHYHGDNATVADPLGSKAGTYARIRDTVLKEDTQAMFVLPEAANSPSKVDSPDHSASYHVSWSNVKDQVQTVDDALAAAKVDKKAVTERVVSAHSGGGMALNNLINADAKGGTRLQADRLELYDCLYHFNRKIGEKEVDGKKVPIFDQPPEWWTDARLAAWSKTPNGQAVKQVTFFSAGSDDGSGSRSGQLAKSFPADANGTARFKLVDMSKEPPLFDKNGKTDPAVDPVARDANNNTVAQKVLVRKQDDPVAHNYRPDNHYRTVGQHLGERPKP